ncbi:MAG: substrate-binding domain-containing protein [Muribaculaceae bacterium]|nr:substrate-binding domain-containing protein [Muribaculaceae bacterium]
MSQCSEDDWRHLMNEEINQEIMFFPEASVEIRSADDSNEKQIADIRYFIDNDFDIIIAAPNEADALTPVLSEAYEKGIPVLIFDRSVNGDSYTAFHGADNAAIGSHAALYAAKILPEGGTMIELTGLSGSTPARERGRGFQLTLDTLPVKIERLAAVSANWNFDDAERITDSLLSIYPDVDLIYAHNDRMALGAAEVAARRGLHPHIIGVDAAPNIGMKAVAEGKIDATFIYPTEGGKLVRTAMAILKGEPYEHTLLTPASAAVDSSNVDLLIKQHEQLNEENGRMMELKKQVDSYWNQHNSQTAILYASIAILVLVCVVLFLVLKAFWQHRRHKNELLEKNRMLEEQRDLEKELNSQLAAATQSKLVFFTNVSHDLRTPLTLIADPVEQVAKAPNLTPDQKVLMRIAQKNVNILRRLINQILDFRKYDNDKLDLNLEEVDPARLATDWAEAFMPLAARKHIAFTTDFTLPEGFTTAFDVDKIERVIFNILSNAFKFTPVKGAISFGMTIADGFLQITVKDKGRGISAENLKHIFSRFYQVDKVRPEGSGIGLSLSKAFVELHGGNIKVESREDVGSEFIVLIPVKHVENKASESTMKLSSDNVKYWTGLIHDAESDTPAPALEKDDKENEKPILLVIDDNEDMRLMIKQLLKDEYYVISAPDGKEGIKMATKYVPDVIVCDVMMPGIDGMETCAAIKSEISTSHIPVLMLTACSLDEQRVESYESGADGYMSKPFNSDVLKARLGSLIANRQRIKEVLGSKAPASLKADASSEGAAKRKDIENEFYNRFVEIVNQEMGNIDLSVDTLAEKMGMGRSQFYRKIKALTNLSPVELLRDLRLKRARDLLLTSDKTISEIAYEVGFSTPAYFSKCYREVYSETPSALRERMRK